MFVFKVWKCTVVETGHPSYGQDCSVKRMKKKYPRCVTARPLASVFVLPLESSMNAGVVPGQPAYDMPSRRQPLARRSIEHVNSLREVQALKRLNPHPNILTLIEVV